MSKGRIVRLIYSSIKEYCASLNSLETSENIFILSEEDRIQSYSVIPIMYVCFFFKTHYCISLHLVLDEVLAELFSILMWKCFKSIKSA